MPISKKLSIVLTFIILFSMLLPTVSYANDAGPPLFFNPNVDVTFTVDSDKAAPNKELHFTIDFTNNSNKTLYINDIVIDKEDNLTFEDSIFYFDNIDAIVKPNETFTFKETIVPAIENFRFINGKMLLYLSPTVYYHQYAPYSEKLVIGTTFQSFANDFLKLTWNPPFNIESPIDVSYTYQKLVVEGNILYDFTIKMKNTTDKELFDLQIISDTIVEGAIATTEDLSYLAPGEEKSVSYTYDNSKAPTPYIARKQFVVYVISRYKDSNDFVASIAKNIGKMSFDIPALKLEAKITCDVDKANFGENIPLTLELYNPTKHTYKNIKFPTLLGEDIEEIKPNETVTRELEVDNYFDYFSNTLSEGLEKTYTIKPIIDYQGHSLSFDEWCTNYTKTTIPEVVITMPPQTENLKLSLSSKGQINDNAISIDIENTSEENVEIEFIGCTETLDYNDYVNAAIPKGKKETINFTPSIAALVADNKNVYVDLYIIGVGETTRNLYWIHDYYKIDFTPTATPTPKPTPTIIPTAKPTPTPSPTPTPAPSPTSTPTNHKLIATIKSNNDNNDNAQCIDLLLFNNSGKSFFDVKVLDNGDHAIYTLKELPANEYTLVNLRIPSKEKISLDVTYRDAQNKNLKVKTNQILSLKLNNTKQINAFGNIFLLVAVLVLISFIIIIIYQIKHRRNNNEF